MKYLMTLSEHTPTADGSDINTYHITGGLVELISILDEFEINYGCMISATIVPMKVDF